MLLRTFFPIIVIVGGYLFTISNQFSFFLLTGELISTISTIAQISATMMGFMLTALAILASISDKNLVKNMAIQGHYKDLINHLTLAALIYFILFIYSMAVLFVGNLPWKNILLSLACGSFIVTLQVIYKLWFVLKNIHHE